MSISQRLNLKQSQSMVMTPQLQQSIKLLQLTTAELISYIDEELEKNPFLQEDGDDADRAADNGEDYTSQPEGKDTETTLFETAQASHSEEATPIVEGEDGSNVWDDGTVSSAVYEGNENLTYSGTTRRDNSFDNNDSGLENIAGNGVSLREHIEDQINIEIESEAERIIALYLTDQLDESGYLTIDLEDARKSLQCNKKTIENVLKTLQGFDPAGIFARDLSECLALQLKDRNHFDPAIEMLLANLDLLAEGNFKALQRRCEVSEEDLQDMIKEVRALNPKPASGFMTDTVQIMQPDVFLKRSPDDGWIVEVNNEALPRLLVNRRYYAQVESQLNDDSNSKKYLSEQINTANWLIKALDQRANTILKVTTEIVAQQDKFLRHGIQYLKPLVLNDIAEKVEMHESTVSRVINGKFMATHIGVFELKYFFSSSVQSHGGGDDVSSKTVKHLIKELIDSEPSDKTYSDDTLVKLLSDKGINIARRTVMKYRESMGIGSSVERRRAKKLQG